MSRPEAMSGPEAMIARSLELADYRRGVAELYADLRRRGVDRRSWNRWRQDRARLLTTHPQSPLDAARRARPDPVAYFDYDPTWRVIATVEPFDGGADRVAEGDSTFSPIGSTVFERNDAKHRLGLYWLQGYGGGLFLPFVDPTNGVTTYGGGRYLLDGAKSADLGRSGPDGLLLDFNFAYHPSCAWDPQWACPLAPPANRLAGAVEAGERLDHPGASS